MTFHGVRNIENFAEGIDERIEVREQARQFSNQDDMYLDDSMLGAECSNEPGALEIYAGVIASEVVEDLGLGPDRSYVTTHDVRRAAKEAAERALLHAFTTTPPQEGEQK